jgi:hypothetical protein
VIKGSPCPEERLSHHAEACKFVTICRSIDYSSTQLVFIHLVDLGARCTPGLRTGTFQGALRLGVGELLELEDL